MKSLSNSTRGLFRQLRSKGALPPIQQTLNVKHTTQLNEQGKPQGTQSLQNRCRECWLLIIKTRQLLLQAHRA